MNGNMNLLGAVGSGVFGLTTGTFVAQAVAAAAGSVPSMPEWTSFGLGGFALTLAMWMVRESYQRRIEEAKEFAGSIERIYAAKVELQKTVIQSLQTQADRWHEMLQTQLGKERQT